MTPIKARGKCEWPQKGHKKDTQQSEGEVLVATKRPQKDTQQSGGEV